MMAMVSTMGLGRAGPTDAPFADGSLPELGVPDPPALASPPSKKTLVYSFQILDFFQVFCMFDIFSDIF